MFEWDEDKRLTNIAKHGVDLLMGRVAFDGRPSTTLPSRFLDEDRFITTALIGVKLYSVVWTWRDANRRLISLRRAHGGEERNYRAVYGRGN